MRVELRCTKGELDGLIAKTKNASRRQRLRVIRWALEGLTADEVATQTKLCRRQVQNWVRRFNGDRLGRVGRPPGTRSSLSSLGRTASPIQSPTGDGPDCERRSLHAAW